MSGFDCMLPSTKEHVCLACLLQSSIPVLSSAHHSGKLQVGKMSGQEGLRGGGNDQTTHTQRGEPSEPSVKGSMGPLGTKQRITVWFSWSGHHWPATLQRDFICLPRNWSKMACEKCPSRLLTNPEMRWESVKQDWIVNKWYVRTSA